MSNPKLRVCELFAGIGGFRLGIEQALDKKNIEVVYVSEWDKYAAATYEKNFNHTVDTRSITDVPAESIPDHDLLVGGFPCQAFSIAGKRRGFDDTRGTLFFDIARILQEKRTPYCVLENVKGLLSHDFGRTFKRIIRTLTDLGYDLQWQMLNSKDFGVPQNRERIFIVGHLRGQPRPQVFPIRNHSEPDIVLPTLTARYWGGQANGGYIGNKTIKVGTYRTHKDGQGFREVKSGLAPTIPARAREDGSGQPVVMAWSKSHRTGKTDADKKRKNYGQVENRVKLGEFNTLSTGPGGGNQSTQNFIYQSMKIRRLTPKECERLQGFPDGWTDAVSDAQRYKQLGNAVTVNVVSYVMKRFEESLNRTT